MQNMKVDLNKKFLSLKYRFLQNSYDSFIEFFIVEDNLACAADFNF